MRKVCFKMFFLLLMLCPLNVFAANSYFDGQELTAITTSRSKAQTQVQAVAEQYLYKKLYTDYEQKNQDVSVISVNNKKYALSDSGSNLSKTFSYRNLNMTPFEISRSNYNIFDCTGFVSNVYLNAFGFDFGDYFSLQLDGKNVFKQTYVNNNSNKISIDYNSNQYNRNAFMHSGKAVYTSALEKIQRSLSPNIDNTKASDNKNSLFVYKYENSNGITLNQLHNLEKYLQTGDILLYRRKLDKTVDGKTKTYTSGHVMIYVDDYNGNNGFIHSTGKDFKYNYDSNTAEEFGIDNYSVRFIKFSSKYEKSDEVEINKKGYITYYVAIIRPINIVLNGKYTNAYTKTNDKKTTVNIDNLRDMRSKGYNLSMQQYLYNNTQKKYISSSNVINSGDEISVKAFVKNNGTEKKSFTITMPYSDYLMQYKVYGCKSTGEGGGTISKCSDMNFVEAHKDENNKKVTFAVELRPGQYIYTYYKFNYVHRGSLNNELTIPGMTLSYGDKQIKFKDLSITGANSNLSSYSSVISKIDNYYLADGEKKNRGISLLRMYHSVFGVDFLEGSELDLTDRKTNTTIFSVIKGLFTDRLDEEEGLFYNPNNEQLERYVVPGMYGGRIVRGNLDNKRIHRLSYEQLEPGDIVIAYNNASNKEYKSFMFVYGGYKEQDSNTKEYTIYLRQKDVYIVRKRALNLLARAWASEAFVVLRPSQVSTIDVNSSGYFGSVDPRIEQTGRILDDVPEDSNDIMTDDEAETIIPNTSQNNTIDTDEDSENFDDNYVESDEDDVEEEEEDDEYIENRVESPLTSSVGKEIIGNIPDTAIFKSKATIIIGLIFLMLGVVIFRQVLNKKTNKN